MECQGIRKNIIGKTLFILGIVSDSKLFASLVTHFIEAKQRTKYYTYIHT